MKFIRTKVHFFAFLLLASLSLIGWLSAVGCTGPNPNLALSVGTKPPALNASTLDGKGATLAQFEGSVVLLNFWASWCGPCVEELPALERLYQALKGRGFVVVGVGIDDTVENLESRARSLGVTFPILVDRGTAKETFRLTGVPETLLLDREGKLLLMLDPDTGQASSRILGPRDWDEPKMVRRIASLLAQ